MSIKQNGGVFGRNPTFNDVTIEGQLTFNGDIDINSDLKVDGDIETTGNVIIATSGKGIDFSATSGTGTSELLDDYEEGTWTPTFNFWSTAPTSVGARYTKTGRQVTINLIAVNGASLGSNAQIAGLPFASNSLNGASCVLSAISATNENSTGNISDNSSIINYIAAVDFGASYWCMSITYIV